MLRRRFVLLPVLCRVLVLLARYRLRARGPRPQDSLPEVAASRGRLHPQTAVKLVFFASKWTATSCLPRSLALAHLLRINGHHADVVIGLPSDGAFPSEAPAHAWVETEALKPTAGFVELVRFRGRDH